MTLGDGTPTVLPGPYRARLYSFMEASRSTRLRTSGSSGGAHRVLGTPRRDSGGYHVDFDAPRHRQRKPMIEVSSCETSVRAIGMKYGAVLNEFR